MALSNGSDFAAWSERLVVLASARAQPSLLEIATSVAFQVEVYTAPPAMLVHCGANPPSCVMIDCAVRGVEISSVVKALLEITSVPAFVGVWEDEASKRRAVTALDAGAIGIVSMPTSAEEVARMVHQSGGRANARFTRRRVGRIAATWESREVWVGEVKIQMPEFEFGLLWRLMDAFPIPIPSATLRLGDSTTQPVGTDALTHRIMRLRRRLEEASPGAGDAVKFIRSAGYTMQEV